MNWIEEAFYRIKNALDNVNTHLTTLFRNQDETVRRILDDEKAIRESFDVLVTHIKEIHQVNRILSQRIDTLEMLASKKFVDEIEKPHFETKRNWNS